MGPTRCGEVSGQDDGAIAWPEPRRRRAQAAMRAGVLGAATMASGRENEEGEDGQWLTADAGVASACSGKHRSERSGEGELRRPATKMMKMAMMQGLRRRVARWRGRGRCGGASGLLEGARERRWPRRCSSVAVDAFGEMGNGEGESWGESEVLDGPGRH